MNSFPLCFRVSYPGSAAADQAADLTYVILFTSSLESHCKLEETADYGKHVLALWEYSSENALETKAKGFIGE